MPFLQVTRFCASSFRNVSFLISSTTHSCHVFLPLPFSPSTTVALHAATQSSLFLCSTCPNHLNLPCRTTSNTHSIPNRLNNSSFVFLSFNVTPHIHLTIILSALSTYSRGTTDEKVVSELLCSSPKIEPFQKLTYFIASTNCIELCE